jgi:hypothetical protein
MLGCGHGDMDMFDPNRYEKVEVTDDELHERLKEWVEAIQSHPGQLVLTHDSRRQSERRSTWDVHVGVIRPDITEEEIIEGSSSGFFRGIDLTDGEIAWANHGELRFEDKFPVKVGQLDAYNSFQGRIPQIGPQRSQRYSLFELVVGDEAVAQWFSDEEHRHRAYQYYQICKRLGVEVEMTPEVTAAVEHRKSQLTIILVKKALSQNNLVKSIDAVYESVGKGPRFDGYAIGMSPESTGEANLRTHRQRQERDQNLRSLHKIKAELLELGVDEAQFYANVAALIGLDLIVVEE